VKCTFKGGLLFIS